MVETGQVPDFKITLGPTYYEQGYINPGVAASRLFGDHGEPLVVYLGSREDYVQSRIDTRANQNGTVRVVGRNQQIAKWFRTHFDPGDVVNARVLDRNHLLLLQPQA